jgi:hypothetical protein
VIEEHPVSHRRFISFLSLMVPAALALVSAAPATAQAVAKAASPKSASTAKGSTVPRTPDGQPDLQGIWNSSSITPLERPVELGNKEFYTKEEAAAYERVRNKDLDRDRRDGSAAQDAARAYNDAWFDRGSHLGSTLRTSRVIDPPNGRFPAFTPAAQKKYNDFHAWFAAHPADGPETRNLFDRCLMFSQSGPPMIPGNYNNNYQIVQTADTVAILSEMPHQTRIIPLGKHPSLPTQVPQWEGDSQGHWEGNTLVVETTNVRFNDFSHFGTQYEGMSDENLRITERFTRTGPDTLIYRATVNDPTVYTKPWTIELPMAKTDEAIYEYACHEGNYGLAGILSGARAEEKKGLPPGRVGAPPR